jgi:hypothetical protein
MKVNKKIYQILENMYNTNINEPRSDTEKGMADYEDLPYVVNDDEYKTHFRAEDVEEVNEDLEDAFVEPEIRTKKGKNILREPPPTDPEASEIHNIKIFDKTRKKVIGVVPDDDLKDLDRSEPEETVEGLQLYYDLTEAKLPKDDDDPNNLGGIAQDNIGEQNPSSGQDPNVDPNQVQPDPNAMMGGQMSPGGAYQDPNEMMGESTVDDIDPITGQPKMSLEVVGKVYELKKIYSRLLAIQSQLSFSPDSTLTQLRQFITKSIDLFETVISNIGLYKKEIDDIIVMYYDFIKEVYDIMKKYYKKTMEEEQNKNRS